MAKKMLQEVFGFARMTPAEYLDDLQQLRLFADDKEKRRDEKQPEKQEEK